MTLNSAKVRVAISGAAYFAPTSTAAPTTAVAALDAAFLDLGYLSEDGVKVMPSKTDTSSITAWQSATEVRKAVTKVENTLEFTAIEVNVNSLSLYTGVTVTGSSFTFGGPGTGRFSFVLDVIDGAEQYQLYVPEAEVTERKELVFKNGEPLSLPMTLTAYPAVSLSGLSFKFFSKNAL